MRWVVHIGAPKTGSTAIQRFLFDNRARLLLEHGVHYPDVSLRGFGHHDLAFLLYGKYAHWATPQDRPLTDLADELGAAIRHSSAETTILSSENFYIYPKPEALRTLLLSAGLEADDEVVIVCYVRRQDDAHVSWYNQSVKAQGNASSFERTVRREHGLWNYAERLETWASIFGEKSILVRDYTAFGQKSSDIRADLLDILGVDSSLFHLPVARENERINRDILAFQRLINHLPLSAQKKRRYHKQLIELTAASAGSEIFDDTPLLSSERQQQLMASYRESNAIVAKTYLQRETLFEPQREPDIAFPSKPVRSGLTLRKIFHILAWITGDRRRFNAISR